MIEHFHMFAFDVANLNGVNEGFAHISQVFNQILEGFWKMIHWIENK